MRGGNAGGEQKKGIQSFELGISILECIERATGPLSLTKIAQACGMTVSKAHFYLVSLNRAGLVTQDSVGGHYRLGPAALRLGLSALAKLDILELARAEMARLSELTGDTVFLSIWGHSGPTVISRFDGANVAPLVTRVGAVMPLTASATGRVFLAWLPSPYTRDLLDSEYNSSGRNVIRSRDKLHAVLERIRRDGYVMTPGAVVADMIAIAAPVFDHSRRLQCVLTITEQSAHLDIAARRALAQVLRQTSEKISCSAGFVGPTVAPNE